MIDPIAAERVRALFGSDFQRLRMRVQHASYDSQAFGNWSALLTTDDFDLRVENDRGDIYVSLRPNDGGLDYFELDPLRAHLTQSDIDEPWDGQRLAVFLGDHYDAVRDALSVKRRVETVRGIEQISAERYVRFVAQHGDPTKLRGPNDKAGSQGESS